MAHRAGHSQLKIDVIYILFSPCWYHSRHAKIHNTKISYNISPGITEFPDTIHDTYERAQNPARKPQFNFSIFQKDPCGP